MKNKFNIGDLLVCRFDAFVDFGVCTKITKEKDDYLYTIMWSKMHTHKTAPLRECWIDQKIHDGEWEMLSG